MLHSSKTNIYHCIEVAPGLTSVFTELVTVNRLNELPPTEQSAWKSYPEKSRAGAILSYQTPSGGWSKHLDFSEGPRKPGMQWTSQNEPGQPAHYLATFDNSSTTAEMEFPAKLIASQAAKSSK